MSNTFEKIKQETMALSSGEPGTTGREPFEDSMASGPGQAYSSTGGAAGAGTGLEGGYDQSAGGVTGQHHHHHHHGGHHTGTVGGVTNAGAGTGQTSGIDTSGTRDADAYGAGAGSGVAAGGAAAVGAGAGTEGIRHSHEGHSHHQGHHERQEHSHHHGTGAGVGAAAATGAGAAGSGLGGGAAGGTVADYSQSGTGVGGTTGSGLEGTSGLTGGAGSAVAARDHTDRVGSLNQGGAAYERTTDQGPITSGAAGTDRFDTDNVRTGTGATGTTGGVGTTEPGWQGEGGATQPKSGGLMGIIGTSDKDFINRDRKGAGAYHDDQGVFKSNTSGPGGNTALTGREGTFEKNPIAQMKSREGNAVHPEDPNYQSGTGVGSGPPGSGVAGSTTETETARKPSLMEKIKDVLT